jgi:hypothetical protein
MLLSLSYTTWFVIAFITINIIFSIKLYTKTRIYFRPVIVNDSDNTTEKLINIHDKFTEFSRKDNISFPRILFGLIFLFWIRMILMPLIVISCYLVLKLLNLMSREHNATYHARVKKCVYIHSWLTMFVFGARRTVIAPNCDNVYKKYLGEDYERQAFPACLISNHASWFDTVYLVGEECPGFIAKASVKQMPFVGYIAEAVGSLFLDRTSESDRNYIVIFK